MSLRVGEVVMDCAEHGAVVDFWQAALDYERQDVNEQYVGLAPRDKELGRPPILFQKVPEAEDGQEPGPPRLPGRVHGDEVARLQGLGATFDRGALASARSRGPCWPTPRATSSASPDGDRSAPAETAVVPRAPRAGRPCRGRRRPAASTTSTGRSPGPASRTGSSERTGRKELPPVADAAVDVAADVVGVVRLHRRGVLRRPGEDAVAEPGREPLDLGLDRGGHVDGRAVGHVAVRPRDVLALRGARRVRDRRLDEQHERPSA